MNGFLSRSLILLMTSCALGVEDCGVASGVAQQCRVDESSGSQLYRPHERHFFINGTWVEPADSSITLDVIDPSTALAIATISLGSQADTDAAVAAAQTAFPAWSQLTTKDRTVYVQRLLKAYKKRRREMALLISSEMGAPIDFALDSQVGSGSYHIGQFIKDVKYFQVERTVPGVHPDEAATTIFMEPVGVVGMITPWNWPLNQIALKVVPALLVGCTCVLKPSEEAPLSALLFAEIMDEAGFPPGVFNLVNGDGPGVGTQLSRHTGVDMISFTGSTRAGALVSKNAADTFKRLSLELGGKGANIIFADVGKKLKKVVTRGVWSCFGNSGQSCNAPTRMLVERSIYDQAVEIAIEVANQEVVASAHQSGDHIGPVVNKVQFEKIQKYIKSGIEEGAKLVAGGLGRPEGVNDQGFYVRPTVFANCNTTMTIMREEIFGPVLCMMPFDTEEEAVLIANDTPYGLTNYVKTSDPARRQRLARALKSGMVEMNGKGQDDGAPFGGMKASGNGREGGVYGLEEFCEIKAVTGLYD